MNTSKKHRICVCVSGGVVQSVFSDLSTDEVQVELYDFDDARQDSECAYKRMTADYEFASKTLHTIF